MTTLSYSLALAARVSRSSFAAGTSTFDICSTVATCMTIGKVSFDDWLRLTSSLG
jgi:hypothetical protein